MTESCDGQLYKARVPTADEQGSAYIKGVTDDSDSDFAVPGANMLRGEEAMMAGILMYGAIFASYQCCSDFAVYTGGIFVSQSKVGCGGHAVHAIGWGVEKETKYWIVENSWGDKWGENQNFMPCSAQACEGDFCKKNDDAVAVTLLPDEKCGYFRIRKGTNEVDFEVGSGHHWAEDLTSPPAWLSQKVEGVLTETGAATVVDKTFNPDDLSKAVVKTQRTAAPRASTTKLVVSAASDVWGFSTPLLVLVGALGL